MSGIKTRLGDSKAMSLGIEPETQRTVLHRPLGQECTHGVCVKNTNMRGRYGRSEGRYGRSEGRYGRSEGRYGRSEGRYGRRQGEDR